MPPGFALRGSKALRHGCTIRDAAAEPIVQCHSGNGHVYGRVQCPLLRTGRLTNRELRALKVEFSQKFGNNKGGAVDGISPKKSTWGIEVDGKALAAPKVTKSDAEFAEEGIVFVEGHEGVNIPELNNLFEKVGFPRRDPEKLKIALENTHTVIWIRYAKNTRWAKLNQLLGFARAMSDGCISASIWDVAVLPAWQRSGLGRALMERLLVRLRADSINTITLYAEPNVVGMYEKLGFIQDADGIRGMAFQRKSRIGLNLAKPRKRQSATSKLQ